MKKKINRFEVYLVDLNPTKGSEINKTRPCVVISPDAINNVLNTVIIAPLTTTKRKYPSRVNTEFQNVSGQICLDQIRTIDQVRLNRHLGKINQLTALEICSVCLTMFAY